MSEIEKEFAAELSSAILKIRREHNLSQSELSRITGINQPVISRIEKQLILPRIGTILKLIVPFGMKIAVVDDVQ